MPIYIAQLMCFMFIALFKIMIWATFHIFLVSLYTFGEKRIKEGQGWITSEKERKKNVKIHFGCESKVKHYLLMKYNKTHKIKCFRRKYLKTSKNRGFGNISS